ncbi:MAG: Flp pilus assembly complex ATPase component TadA [Candidatus Aenigmatarchaeota archaeon]|nr:MAG: Flp pilus assembly complex ATPase component TadA [Candidatus Aenigmarchaeota archaeon]
MKENNESVKRIVPDTSIIIDGKLSEMIDAGDLRDVEIVIPEMVLDELQSQANRGLEIGFDGLREIKKLRELADAKGLKITTTGRRPTAEEIKLAKKGRIDALIRDAAKEFNATLYTADLVQSEVAQADGLNVFYVAPTEEKYKLLFEDLLDKETMSLHLKEGAVPQAKHGKPGHVTLVKLRRDALTRAELEQMAENIVYVARHRDDAQFEITMTGAEVIQIGEYRIAITKPPFSRDYEITVVRPLVKLTLEDYKPTEKLIARLREHAEGILISGPPGSGKSTFVQSLAEFYLKQDKIIKTMESPRDLRVPAEVTQYGPLNGNMANTADILLLVRPDYTIYDEIRKTADFRVFADMRLAGVGMVGVVHATKPVDAIQRFIGRTELGMIPHILDTIVYVKDGTVAKVYSIDMKVRVPTGMTEQDLARPVVEIRDFETANLEYEIYTFGEENVVIPVTEERDDPLKKLAAERIRDALREFDPGMKVEFISDTRVVVKVKNEMIPRLIGKAGKNISEIERKLGVSIDVQPKVETLGKQVPFEVDETGAYIVLFFEDKMRGKNANTYIADEYLFTATVGKTSQIRLSKDSDLGKKLVNALATSKEVKVFV